MKKICTLFYFLFSFSIVSFSQKFPNPKIGKNEAEITSFILADGTQIYYNGQNLVYGGQLVYRLAILKGLKVGAGVLYGVNHRPHNSFGYGAVFTDVLQLLGHRQKWGFGGLYGHGICNQEIAEVKLKAGLYYSVSCNYRAIVSKRLMFNTSLFTGHRNLHYSNGNPERVSAMLGLKFGVVF